MPERGGTTSGCVGVIGFGAIARSLVGIVCAQGTAAPSAMALLVRPGREEDVRQEAERIAAGSCRVTVTSDPDAFAAQTPTVVAECAGHGAVADHVPALLSAGIDVVVASVGALADAALADRLSAAAVSGGAQLVVPAGAMGGIDVLAAARLSGLHEVSYTGRKPPAAWRGTPAEGALDLSALTQEAVFFEGTAREAATAYPKNANVAATLALAGLGMDATRVRLAADPAASGNVHEVSVRSAAVDFTIRLAAKPSPDNPRTSASTAYSIARAVLNRRAGIVI